MAYDPEAAARKLKAALEEMQKISSNTGVRLSQAHLYSDALVALSQADACRLGPFARAMALMGTSMQFVSDLAMQQVEDRTTQERLGEARVSFLALTEDLTSEALQARCGCRVGDEPARLLGDLFRI